MTTPTVTYEHPGLNDLKGLLHRIFETMFTDPAIDDEFVNECIRKAEAEFEDDPQNEQRTVKTPSVQEDDDD